MLKDNKIFILYCTTWIAKINKKTVTQEKCIIIKSSWTCDSIKCDALLRYGIL